MNWDDIGLKMGLEIHQQLNTKSKLFCPCPTELNDDIIDLDIKRKLRPTQSELGQIDRAAFAESKRKLNFNYQNFNYKTCLVESDDEPPHGLNEEALDLSITIASLLNMKIIDEVHTMRKQVIDGSNTGGFQRTSLIATDGFIDTPAGRVVIENLCLEEDAARRINKTNVSKKQSKNTSKNKKDFNDNNDFTTFRLDRLGIPLVEITTDPSIHHPDQIKEVAYILGQILRSTNVKRGQGTIRQDLNISIAKGSRVELKGVQNLDLIPEMAKLEVDRQQNLIKIQEELMSRGAVVEEEIHDLTEIFKNSPSKIIQSAKTVKGIVLKGFNGLIGLEIQKNRRFGTELATYAKKTGVSGIFHTDELPAYGIESDETEAMKKHLNIGENDAIVIVAHDRDVATSALEEVILRSKMAFDGVPEETRKALEDGTSEYMRPLPTQNRMYLETDIQLFKINEERIKVISSYLPELPNEKKERIIKQYSLSEDIANQIVRRGYTEDFEKIISGIQVDSITLGSFFAYSIQELKREGLNLDLIELELITNVFNLLKDNKISKDSIYEIIKEIIIRLDEKSKNHNVNDKNNDKNQDIDPEIVAQNLGLILISDDDVKDIILFVVEKNAKMIEERKMAALGPLMGMAMKELKGKADGKIVNQLLKDEIEKRV
ncbi:Glu-tRNA(Gln) amidotransferase subunit GatE [Methanobrevibacter curvatus]|uniref:Glutamyl-tRNA(Gln) amidotransferase subunit E n=1 Tax=Methanobrevibacter curvatus TaxID=49547 RepID=A0A166A8W9_9EURY|nr:Glu-tRNA(Gln) amidotransferase subunit GatE [Methanobrevibacter curvatus]KZX11724.1 aspartyl/glutamyl-tRNA(Asn/Gln) amidotransferase subunit B [Methanobrevibacter curvatus]